jgi:hypothetical protein
VLLLGALVACDKNGGGGTGPSDPDEAQFLIDHNARFNDGHTVRWRDLPIPVFTAGIARESEVTEWTRVTGGRVTFSFVGSPPGRGISFGFGGGDDICGVTTVEFNNDGEILSADVRVVESVYRGPLCQRTVEHEVAHAIGFLDHTADGTLMDPDGGDGRITEEVVAFFNNLYSFEPGTRITAGQIQRGVVRRGAGGRRVVTIVDPIRR